MYFLFFRALKNDINIIQFGEFLLCAGAALNKLFQKIRKSNKCIVNQIISDLDLIEVETKNH